MSETKLLRCPFCGGEAKLIQFYPYMSRRIRTVIRCTKCRANSGEWRMKNKAIEAWNTRKPMQSIVERLEKRKAAFYEDWEQFGNEDDYGAYFATDRAIEIVKEEGGIDA